MPSCRFCWYTTPAPTHSDFVNFTVSDHDMNHHIPHFRVDLSSTIQACIGPYSSRPAYTKSHPPDSIFGIWPFLPNESYPMLSVVSRTAATSRSAILSDYDQPHICLTITRNLNFPSISRRHQLSAANNHQLP